MTNANAQLAGLITSHGFEVEQVNGILRPKFKQYTEIDSQITTLEYPNGVSSQLDIQVKLQGGKIIHESFGDIGENTGAATRNNLENFVRSSFHVLVCALNDLQDEQILIEEWITDGWQWTGYIGNYNVKSSAGTSVYIPNGLFDAIKKAVELQDLTGDFHWMRTFFCFYQKQLLEAECTFDNVQIEIGFEELLNLDWELTESFYSVRHFLILKRVEG